MGQANRRITRAAIPVAAAIFLAAIAAAQPDVPYLPERETRCYECHAAWTPPLVQMYNILPPEDASGKIGESFDLNVRIQNAWISELVYFEPYVELQNAPSLIFQGETPPALGITVEGSIDQTQGGPTVTDSVEIEVTPGSTDLKLQLFPENTDPYVGPDLELRVLAPNNQNDPLVIDEAGAGQPETLRLRGVDNITELGYGAWTIQVASTAIVEGGVAQQIDYRVIKDAYFNTSATTKQYIVERTDIKPEKSILFTWRLQPVAEPEEGEFVRVMVNLTAYYKHTSNSPDFGNYTKSIDLPVRFENDEVRLAAEVDPDAQLVQPAGPVGISMARVSEVVGYASGFLLVFSVWTGGMFGRASRRHLNIIFQSAKRRVGFHNFLSYGLTAAAAVHTVLFIIETNYEWTLGIIWGGIAILAMLALGVTGALQVPMIRKWNYATWRWSHFALAIAAILFTVVHMLLDGANFGDVQDFVGWEDPFSDFEWGQ